MSLQAVWDVENWTRKPFTLPVNLGQTLVPTEVLAQISLLIVGRRESEVTPETPVV